jgi:hypothetical protein
LLPDLRPQFSLSALSSSSDELLEEPSSIVPEPPRDGIQAELPPGTGEKAEPPRYAIQRCRTPCKLLWASNRDSLSPL